MCNRCPSPPPKEKYPVARTYRGYTIVMSPDNADIRVGVGWAMKSRNPATLRVGDVTEWGEIIEIHPPAVSTFGPG